MDLSLDNIRVTAPDNILTREVDKTLVLLDIDTGRSFTLDPVGARVWTLLTSTGSLDTTCQALLSEFAGDPAQIRSDVQQIAEQLVARKLLATE